MESTTMCEACNTNSSVPGRYGERYSGTPLSPLEPPAPLCRSCWDNRPAGAVIDSVRERRRSRPAAELEALEFVAPRDHRVTCPDAYHEEFRWYDIRKGERVKFRDVMTTGSDGAWSLYTVEARGEVRVGPVPEAGRGVAAGRALVIAKRDLPRIHAELCQLRDTPAPQAGGIVEHLCPYDQETHRIYPGEHNKCASCGLTYAAAERSCVYPVDPKRQPEANPLRHLAEAFRSLDKVACANCRVPCSHALVMRGAGPGWCKYCDNRVRVEPGRVFGSATPKEAERREVWDWDVEDVGYLP